MATIFDDNASGRPLPARAPGPLGLGDPNDKTLRRVELDVLIPKKMREKAKQEKCAKEVAEFQKCCTEHNIGLVVACQDTNQKMRECLTHWFRNEGFIKQCTEEYLQERTEYRKTGITQKQKKMGS